MSEQYKYEPIFGDQSLFDGAPEDAVAVRVNDCKSITYYFLTEEHLALTNSRELKAIPVIAMRRIIKTPVWTMADKEDGRLPEVGCEVILRTSGELATVNAVHKNMVCLTFSDGSFSPFNVERIDPIETPEEKAARLREEWKNNAIEIHHGKRRKMSTSTFLLDDIYDALLSGELSMPVKDGE